MTRESEYVIPAVKPWGATPGLDLLPTAPAWTVDALCAQTDPEVFFPEKSGTTKPAKRICDGCPVRQQCLDYALDNEEPFGIWGGLSVRERRALIRARREAAA